jgi:hypothetical protein
MRFSLLACAFAALLAGCATSGYDGLAPVPGGFVYHAPTDAFSPAGSPLAEGQRIAALTRSAVRNNICPAGWAILSRRYEPHSSRYLGIEVGELIYDARCIEGG